MEVVINTQYGGFSLSEAGVKAYAARKGFPIYACKSPHGFSIWSLVPQEEREDEKYREQTFNDRDLERNDPDLIEVVKALGKAANGRAATLKIIEIPDDVEWQVEEYDGAEWIAEKHRVWP